MRDNHWPFTAEIFDPDRVLMHDDINNVLSDRILSLIRTQARRVEKAKISFWLFRESDNIENLKSSPRFYDYFTISDEVFLAEKIQFKGIAIGVTETGNAYGGTWNIN